MTLLRFMLLLGLLLPLGGAAPAAPPNVMLTLTLRPRTVAVGTPVEAIAFVRGIGDTTTSGTLTIAAPAGWTVPPPAGCAAWPCPVTVTPDTPVLLSTTLGMPSSTPPDWYAIQVNAVLSDTLLTTETRIEVTPAATTTATATATATATPLPSATSVSPTQGTTAPVPPAPPAPTIAPAAPTAPASVPTSTPAESRPAGDAYENNYDAAHATLLVAGEPYAMTLTPPDGSAPDVDYVTWIAKPGRCDTLATTNLAPGVDTNIELLATDDTVIGGNDDASATELGSQVTWCAVTTQSMIARIAQNTAVPLQNPAASAYTVQLTTDAAPPAPTAPTESAAPAPPVPGGAAPNAPAAPPVPSGAQQPSVPPSVPGTSPLADEAVPGGTGGPAPGASSDPGGPATITIDTGSGTAAVCTPLTETTTPITSTAIRAGTESCEARATISDAVIPQGLAHVAAAEAGLYHGPGAQYARLAVLPQAYRVLLTGPTRNGWVAVSLTYRTGVPPLIGWIWGPYLEVDSWLDPQASQTPDSVAPAGDDVSTLPDRPLPPVRSVVDGMEELAFTVAPATTMPLLVQVCRATSAARRCLPQTGLTSVPIEVLDAQGTVLAFGTTDAMGRVRVPIPLTAGTVTVSAPLLGVVTNATLDGTGQAHATMVVEPVAIPPSFR